MASDTSFASLKRASKGSIEQLTAQIQSAAGDKRTADERFWNPQVDKAGNGMAIIRFLPAPAGDDVPFIKMFDHGFQGSGGWFVEKCPTTLGKDCPACDNNRELWATGLESNKTIVRKQKRNLYFISNVYVVKDPANPDNDGKVFLFRYGKKIFDKLQEKMTPQFADEVAVNPFDLWEGANFRIKIRQVDGYRNYDKSEFDSAGPLLNDDDKMEAIWKKEYALSEFPDPKNFKTFDELKTRLDKVLGLTGGSAKAGRSNNVQQMSEDLDDDIPFDRASGPSAGKTRDAPLAPKRQATTTPVAESGSTGDDDDLAYFQALAEDE